MPIATLDLLDGCMDWAGGVVAGIRVEQRDAATPCPEFTVEGLIAHLIDGLTWYGQLPAGGPTDPREATGPDLRRVPYADAFDAARSTTGRTWTPVHLADTYALPFGETSGTGITEYMIVETLGHGWDLAVAAGQPINVAPDLAEAALTTAHGLGEQTLRAEGMMADAATVPAHAPAISRFVAFLGRQPPSWTTPR
ncbi:TIGR03086 family metal-binding protein [Actinomadura sp. 7K507]|uniref:TIGR03086 family metal-binding protein n=1 Tax=Actinomadura sp. 7K507 TaxID=2530365 RepID=UPI00104E1EEF|nr:TIGR03086 family metal-binding protein [Actinomadura sp. 7K507]TDC94558.1 TIGR03086 family protein [Actinomadura sp. 7K507]